MTMNLDLIMKLNGWLPDTAALQLFAHLDGEALQVALLMPDRIRERWKDLENELSSYYSTPGFSAVSLRRRAAVRGWSWVFWHYAVL